MKRVAFRTLLLGMAATIAVTSIAGRVDELEKRVPLWVLLAISAALVVAASIVPPVSWKSVGVAFATVIASIVGGVVADKVESSPAVQNVGHAVAVRGVSADLRGTWRLYYWGEHVTYVQIRGRSATSALKGAYVNSPREAASTPFFRLTSKNVKPPSVPGGECDIDQGAVFLQVTSVGVSYRGHATGFDLVPGTLEPICDVPLDRAATVVMLPPRGNNALFCYLTQITPPARTCGHLVRVAQSKH